MLYLLLSIICDESLAVTRFALISKGKCAYVCDIFVSVEHFPLRNDAKVVVFYLSFESAVALRQF